MKAPSASGIVFLCLLLTGIAASQTDRPELLIQSGHSGLVDSVAYSPDGRLIATAHSKIIKLWSAQSRKLIFNLEVNDYVGDVAFSPDGETLASASILKLQLWDPKSGKLIRTFDDGGQTLLYSPDGKFIATTSGTGDLIYLRDATSGTLIRRIGVEFQPTRNPDGSMSSSGYTKAPLAMSPDGRLIAIASPGRDEIKVWNTQTGMMVRSLAGHKGGINAIAFSPDGRIIASGGDKDHAIRIWRMQTGQLIRTLMGNEASIYALAFNPKGGTLVSGNWNYTSSLKLWNVQTGRLIHSFEGQYGGIYAVAFSPDGFAIVSGTSDDTVKLWDARRPELIGDFGAHVYSLRELAVSPDGRLIALASIDKTIKVWDVQTGKFIRSLEGHKGYLDSLIFSPNGSLIASSDENATIKIWDAQNGDMINSIEVIDEPSRRAFTDTQGYQAFVIAFSPDGRLLACPGNLSLILLDARSGRTVRRMENTGLINVLAFSPDGRLIATGSSFTRGVFEGNRKADVKIWDAQSGSLVRKLENESGEIENLVFSPDGRRLAINTDVVETQSGNKLYSLETTETGFSSRLIRSLIFGADGQRLLAGDSDNSVDIWEAQTGKLIRSLNGHSDQVMSIALTPDGGKIVSASLDGTAKIWSTGTGELLVSLLTLQDDNWIAYAPDGRYDGSSEASKYVTWRIGNQVYDFDQFFEQFYTPKLLAQVVSEEPATIKQTASNISKGIKFPPLVRITSPSAGESFNAEAVQISVEATDQGGGVDEIRLYQNGKLVSDDTRQLVQTAANNKTFSVTLVAGVNNFRATAFNIDRTESNPAEIKIELKAAEASSDLYILAIGLNEYKNTRYNLNYGRADAQAFADSVEQRGRNIFRKINKQVIFDDQATRKGIEEAFNKIIATAKPQDAFVFYFAGHGVMSEGDDQTPAEFYLVPFDVIKLYGDDGALASNGVAARLLRDLCTKVRAQKQLIVLDACQSAGVLETFAVRGAAEEKAVLQLARSAGIVVIAATGQDQVATEFVKLGHGVFTFALLQAMNGDADGGNPPDGKITATEIVAFINDRVPELTKQYRGKTQYPNAWARGQDFPLGVK